jgi:hypothetical protein
MTLMALACATSLCRDFYLGRESAMTTNSRFTWKHFPSASTVFSCTMLISGEREAVLIDGVITLLDGKVPPRSDKAQ